MNVKQAKQDCCGCAACKVSCPTKAITMQEDSEGFLYPAIDMQKCIHCNICRQVCAFEPGYGDKIGKKAEPAFQQRYFSGKSTNPDVLKHSRSGGVFYAVAQKIVRQKGVVYGIAVTDALEAAVTRVESESDLRQLQGSKYVQATIENAFEAIAQDLKNERTVFFAGTACQVAGICSYCELHHLPTEHLYTADLVCHGVPSPRIFQDNIKELEKKWNIKITAVNFRDKDLGWKSHIESYEGIDQKGRHIKKRYYNKFTSIFYAGVILRPSCHNCQFCNFERPADLTLGDFWGVFAAQPKEKNADGISQIIINSEKGNQLLQGLAEIKLQEVSKEDVSKQPNLFHPTAASEKRQTFWDHYEKVGYSKAGNEFFPWIERIKVPYNRLKNRK